MRAYQMGIVYLDEYGRQSPVFTNDSGGRSLSKEFGTLYNTIEIGMLSNPPQWATHYKFYVKETSNEYYNIALDRFYLPDDGSVWLSFPSADRNKITEETFLELKKNTTILHLYLKRLDIKYYLYQMKRLLLLKYVMHK